MLLPWIRRLYLVCTAIDIAACLQVSFETQSQKAETIIKAEDAPKSVCKSHQDSWPGRPGRGIAVVKIRGADGISVHADKVAGEPLVKICKGWKRSDRL